MSAGGGAGSVGCLPLVTLDQRAAAPAVSQLGVDLADAVGKKVQAKNSEGVVLSTTEMAVRLSEMNVERRALSSLAAVTAHGEKLGVDKIVFGTIQHDYDVGRSGREVLNVSVFGFDVLRGTLLAEEKFGIPSDRRENARYFMPLGQPSTWQAAEAYNVPDMGQSLDGELHVVAGILARRVAALVDFSTISGIVYIPPTDTAQLSQAVAKLRSAQKSFAVEYARRQEEAQTTGGVVDNNRPVVLNGGNYPDPQAAGAELEKQREELLSSDGARFAQQLSSLFSDALNPLIANREIKVNDVGFTKWSDTQLGEGELATGGLSGSLTARSALQGVGVELVVAPRFARFGRSYLLRVEIHDLKNAVSAGSTHFPISSRFQPELEAQLAAKTGE